MVFHMFIFLLFYNFLRGNITAVYHLHIIHAWLSCSMRTLMVSLFASGLGQTIVPSPSLSVSSDTTAVFTEREAEDVFTSGLAFAS